MNKSIKTDFRKCCHFNFGVSISRFDEVARHVTSDEGGVVTRLVHGVNRARGTGGHASVAGRIAIGRK